MALVAAEAPRMVLKHSFLKAVELGNQVKIFCVSGIKGH